jgi:hypothetical protein
MKILTKLFLIIFLLVFYYILKNLYKKRQLYEFIFVQTNSIEITYNQDKNNPQKIDYSKSKTKSPNLSKLESKSLYS